MAPLLIRRLGFLVAALASFAMVFAIACKDQAEIGGYTPRARTVVQTFTSNGTLHVPLDVSVATVTAWGGGGGGGNGGRGSASANVSSGGGGGGSGGVAALPTTVQVALTPGASDAVVIGAGGAGGQAEVVTGPITTTTSSITQPTQDGNTSRTVTPTFASTQGLFANQGLIIGTSYFVVTSLTSTTLTLLSLPWQGNVSAGTVISSGANVYTIYTEGTSGGDTTLSDPVAPGGAYRWIGASFGDLGGSSAGGAGPAAPALAVSRLISQYRVLDAGNNGGSAPNGTIALSLGATVMGFNNGGQGGAGAAKNTAAGLTNFSSSGAGQWFTGGTDPAFSSWGSAGGSSATAGGGGGSGGPGGSNPIAAGFGLTGTCQAGNGGNGGDGDGGVQSGGDGGGYDASNTGNGGCGGGGGGGLTVATADGGAGFNAGKGGNAGKGDNGFLQVTYVTVY